jgi:hypothetical protein
MLIERGGRQHMALATVELWLEHLDDCTGFAEPMPVQSLEDLDDPLRARRRAVPLLGVEGG